MHTTIEIETQEEPVLTIHKEDATVYVDPAARGRAIKRMRSAVVPLVLCAVVFIYMVAVVFGHFRPFE